MIDRLKEKLQNHKFVIKTYHDVIGIDVNFIKKFVTQINLLQVRPYDFTANDMQTLTNSLSSSKKVCFVHYLLFLFKTF